MNTRFLVHAILAAASLACFNASAADLKEVYERALTNDPQIREADANRLATRESKPQALAALLPQVNADGVWNDTVDTNRTGTFIAPGIPLTPDQQNFDGDSSSWNLQLRQSVFRWENWAALKRADSERAQAEADYVVAQQDLVVRTAEAYFNVLAARDTLEAAQAAYDAIGRQLEQSEKRFEVGLIAVTDVQDAKAAFDSASAALIQAKRALANAGELLRELTGDAWDTLEKPGNDMPLAGPNPANPEDWVKLALEQNAALTSSRLAAEITRSNINVERGGHFPAVDFVVSRGHAPVDVPEVRGTTEARATEALTAAGFGVEVLTDFSEKVERGRVMKVAPAEGTTQPYASTVTITVSLGPEEFPAPDFRGLGRDEARALADRWGLELAILAVPATDGSHVLSQLPTAGTTVRYGQTITVWVA